MIGTMEEKQYRALIAEVFKKIEQTFEPVDPDLAEAELSQGTLRVNFGGKSTCILSPQPSVRQIWLAVAAKGIAYHFNYDEPSREWIDDKGQGIKLFQFLSNYAQEAAGLSIRF